MNKHRSNVFFPERECGVASSGIRCFFVVVCSCVHQGKRGLAAADVKERGRLQKGGKESKWVHTARGSAQNDLSQKQMKRKFACLTQTRTKNVYRGAWQSPDCEFSLGRSMRMAVANYCVLCLRLVVAA